MTSANARTGFDDPFDGEDAQAALRAAYEAASLPEVQIPLRVLEDLREEITGMIAAEVAEAADPENDDLSRKYAEVSAFAQENVLGLVNRIIGSS